MNVRTFSVPGVSCDHCKTAIEGELAAVSGVTHSEVDVGAKTVRVEGDATDEVIIAAIDEAGYEATAM
jgi:copper chaperone